MINEKITQLINDLATECKESNVTLSLGAFGEDGKGPLVQVGSNARIEASIAHQQEQWEKNLKECGCIGCRFRLEKLNHEEPDIDVDGDIQSILNVIADHLNEAVGGMVDGSED